MGKIINACCILAAAFLLNTQGANAQQKEDSIVEDSIVTVAFGTVARQNLLGGVSTVNVTDLLTKSYGIFSLDNLRSLVGGYTGNATVWGQDALILIDGVPRSLSDVRLTEVESITVLKGASAVVLYGGTASKGVILINTKRGRIKSLTIDVRANTGIFVPKGYPNYLNAADYKTLYNEALTNDLISTVGAGYTQGEIDSTRAGTFSYKFPDVDFFGREYLKKAYQRSDLTTEISGGNARARYYTNVGLTYNNSLLKYGQHSKNNDFGFNVRGNVDMNLNNWLSASTDVAIIANNDYSGRGDFWGASSTIAPNFNRYSALLPISMIDPNNSTLKTLVDNSLNIIDGKYLLGGQSTNLTNIFADMLVPGYIKTKSRTFLYNVAAKADLSSILSGLSFKTGYSMDYRSFYSENYQVPSYAVYTPTWSIVNGKELITNLAKLGNDQSSTSESIGNTADVLTSALTSQFNYDHTFAQDHNVTAALLGWWYMIQTSSDPNFEGGSDYHPIRNTNLGFQATYNFRHRYYLDFSGALIHSAKLAPGNRNALSPAITLGWRISDEKFLKNAGSFLDNLKVSASYASVKQDLDITGLKPNGAPTDYYLYSGYYNNSGSAFSWRDGAVSVNGTVSNQGANPDLGFIERQEFRTGLDASLFKSLINLEVNYFLQNTNGLLSRGVTVYPSYFTGNGDFRDWINFNNDRRSGVDFAVNLNKNIGALSYSFGVTGMVFSSKATRRDEIFQDQYQYRAGKSLDASWGYISEGFFQDQNDINNHAQQTLGGDIRPGDIKYQDINKDGIIDTKDQINLGRNGAGASPFTYGINLTLKWKNLTLFTLGNGQSGAIAYKNSSYFWVRGTGKFSDVVWNRWTEATKATATYPRLTSTAGNNNYQNSTFWMYKNNRFNLNRVQLTYDFTGRTFLQNSIIHGLSVYVLGDNLLVVSKERDLMETNIGFVPQTRFYNLGVKASF